MISVHIREVDYYKSGDLTRPILGAAGVAFAVFGAGLNLLVVVQPVTRNRLTT